MLVGRRAGALTAHLVLSERTSEDALIGQIAVGVQERLAIGHATVQLETPKMAQSCKLRPDHVV